MDVVTDTGAVRRWVIGAEQRQRIAPFGNRGESQRNEMRLWLVVLAKVGIRVSPTRVEVP